MRLLLFSYPCSRISANPRSLISPLFSKNANPLVILHRRSCFSSYSSRTTSLLADDTDRKVKILVIMGATGSGKTRLSIDLASRFQAEIINSDKMQVYKGLDVTTNKVPFSDRRGVLHHLLGDTEPNVGVLTPIEFRRIASTIVSNIVSRRKLPVLVGGSNSFVHALLSDKIHPEQDVFHSAHMGLASTSLRYRCCFLWLDAGFHILCDHLSRRIDEMLKAGMLSELYKFYNSSNKAGLMRAIGVPEFDRFFEKFPPVSDDYQSNNDDRSRAYSEVVRDIKENTCQLAKRQIMKIFTLKELGWDLNRIDSTQAIVSSHNGCDGVKKTDAWERDVVEPSTEIVKRFLDE